MAVGRAGECRCARDRSIPWLLADPKPGRRILRSGLGRPPGQMTLGAQRDDPGDHLARRGTDRAAGRGDRLQHAILAQSRGLGHPAKCEKPAIATASRARWPLTTRLAMPTSETASARTIRGGPWHPRPAVHDRQRGERSPTPDHPSQSPPRRAEGGRCGKAAPGRVRARQCVIEARPAPTTSTRTCVMHCPPQRGQSVFSRLGLTNNETTADSMVEAESPPSTPAPRSRPHGQETLR